MDPISIYKKQKQDEDDKLSKLPDELILHIFSFLPMKDAVRTSVLSERWEYLWMSIPRLIFHMGYDESDEKITSFVNFVDRSMSLCDSTIKQFSLSLYTEIGSLHIRRWITAAIKHNVEDLCIVIGDFLYFPKCLFASHSLTKLTLSTDRTVEFPSFIFLPSLKHLDLMYMTFPENESTTRFISGCRALETLRLAGCDYSYPQRICICAPRLWKLEIYNETIEESGCDVVINGPSLKCFHYEGDFLNDYCLVNVLSLDEAVIVMESAFGKDDADITFSCLYKLLKGVSRVKKLSLSAKVIETLENRIDFLQDLPLFINLLTLSFFDWGKTDIDSIALTTILHNSPCLESLRFEEGVRISSVYNMDKILDPVPPCFLSCLKRIEMFFGIFNEDQKLFLDAVKILLERAAILVKLTVFLHIKYGNRVAEERAQMELNKKLMELPRVSRVCKLEFPDFIMASTSTKPRF